MKISSKTICYGLLGNPVRHSLSPIMHNVAFEKLGLNGVYLCFEPDEANLKSAVNSVRSLGFGGLNVTIPYKEKVMKFVDEVSLIAEKIGAVNTIYIRDGKLIGTNTDAEGFFRDLRDNLRFVPKNKSCLVLGAGGAAKAVVFALAGGGAKELVLLDRNIRKAKGLARRVKKYYPEISVKILADIDAAYKNNEVLDLVVNATPVGMSPGRPIIDLTPFNRKVVIYDVVYNRRTELVSQAKRLKMKAANGLGMLLYQGAVAFKLWTGKNPPIEIMEKELKKSLKR